MTPRHTERRRENYPVGTNDSPDARYSRSLDQRPPHIRSSQVEITPMSDSSSPLAVLGERIAIVVSALTLVAILTGLTLGL